MIKKFITGITLSVVILSWFSCTTITHAQSIGYNGILTSPAASSIEIMPQALPHATAGVLYSQSFTVVTSEVGPFYWTINGSLPNGLSLSSDSSGLHSTISGIPSATDLSPFTVSVTNRNIAATQTYFFTTNAGSSVYEPVASPIIIPAQSSWDIQAEINAISAKIQQLQTMANNNTTPQESILTTPTRTIFYRNLTLGDSGADVLSLQQLLNNGGYTLVANGPGSPGNETDYFGLRTQLALAKWQTATGILPAFGYFGTATRNQINLL